MTPPGRPPPRVPPQAILSMLQEMNFINTYKMDRQTLTRWGWDSGGPGGVTLKDDPKHYPDLNLTLNITLSPTLSLILNITLSTALSPTLNITLSPTLSPTLNLTLTPTLSLTLNITLSLT